MLAAAPARTPGMAPPAPRRSRQPMRERIATASFLLLRAKADVQGSGFAAPHFDLGDVGPEAVLADFNGVPSFGELDEHALLTFGAAPSFVVDEDFGASGLHPDRQRAVSACVRTYITSARRPLRHWRRLLARRRILSPRLVRWWIGRLKLIRPIPLRRVRRLRALLGLFAGGQLFHVVLHLGGDIRLQVQLLVDRFVSVAIE